uniref:Uncharacterized protein n=1 Tax=Rhizophora mucronata TaxID=61149 RepID=A0A2P2KMW0_RHIMU
MPSMVQIGFVCGEVICLISSKNGLLVDDVLGIIPEALIDAVDLQFSCFWLSLDNFV